MAGSVEVVRRIVDAPALAANQRFRRYKLESEKACRKPDIAERETLREIYDVWGSRQFAGLHPPEVSESCKLKPLSSIF
jgi:hypothetical protein